MNNKLNIGSVTLVGAGPGDVGLLTLRAVEALKTAQVVLTDRLVSTQVLALISPSAQVIYVGKDSGNHPVPQGEINQLLLHYARQGHRVVRLKGGDPYIFGRGGEEAVAVAEAGIPVAVIPGITAALSVPSWTGIPVTHRDYASSVHIITGHTKAGGRLEIDFNAMTRLNGTLIFLMSVASLDQIAEGLLRAGMPNTTSAALVQNGTLPEQRKIVSTLAGIVSEAEACRIASPSVLIVGKVCELSEKLDWFSRMPLAGATVLVTRPESAGGELCNQLQELGCSVIPFPCIHMEPIEDALSQAGDLHMYSWIVFTSAFGVKVFFRQYWEMQGDVRDLAGLRFAAIGSRTAEELAQRGIKVDLVPESYDAAHLANALAQRVKPGQKLLLFRAAKGARKLPELLGKANIIFHDLAAYQTSYHNPAGSQVKKALCEGEINYVTFTSASTVEGFYHAVGREAACCGKFVGLCIGPSTQEAAAQYGIQTVMSGKATIESMVEEIVKRHQNRH